MKNFVLLGQSHSVLFGISAAFRSNGDEYIFLTCCRRSRRAYVEFGLGQGKYGGNVVRKSGVDGGVAVACQEGWYDAAWDGLPAVQEEDFHSSSSSSLSISGGEVWDVMQRSRASFSFRAAGSLLFKE